MAPQRAGVQVSPGRVDQAPSGEGPQQNELQQMVFHTVLDLLTFSPDLIDNTQCRFCKHSVPLFAMVISVNSSYSKALQCEIKFVG